MASSTSRRPAFGGDAPALSTFADKRVSSRLSKARMVRAVLAADGVHTATGAKMLDLGAGSGVVGAEVSAQLGADCVQADVADERIERSLPFVQVTGELLPFPDGTFAFALVNHVIEHVPDQARFLAELRRVLQPGGVCYLATPSRYAVLEPHYKLPLLSWLPQSWADGLVRLLRRGKRYDVAPLTRSELHRLIVAAGFEARDYTAAVAAHPRRFARSGILAAVATPIARLLGSAGASLSPSFVITLRPDASGRVAPSAGSQGLLDWVAERAKGLLGVGDRVRSLMTPVRSRLAAAAGTMASPLAIYTAAFILAVAPALALATNATGAFNAPDETATHLAAKTFAETGHFYIQDDLTLLNPGSTTGPRGFVQLEDRAVPIYSLGFLLVLGVLHFIFGGAAPYVLAVVPGGIALGMVHLVRVTTGRFHAFYALAFLAITPLWYWSSRVYMDIGLTYLFVVAGLLAHVLANQRHSYRWFFVGSAAFAAAAAVRNAEASLLLLLGVASIAIFVRNRRVEDGPALLGALVLYSIAQAAFFVGPTAVLNWMTNGSPTLFGYQVLYAYYWPSSPLDAAGNTFIAPFAFLWRTFFPQPFDLSVAWNGLRYQVLLAMPVVTALGLAGAWFAWPRMRSKLGAVGSGIGIVAVGYIILSRANPGTFLALSVEPDLRASLVRYWMPLYLVLGLGALVALRRTPQMVALALTLALAVSASYQVWTTSPESVQQLRAMIHDTSQHYASVLTANTEPNAVIFAGARVDKWVVPVRRTAGLWSGTDIEIPRDEIMRRIADAGRIAFQSGIPIYYILGPDENFEALANQLAEYHFALDQQAVLSSGVRLWKLKAVPRELTVARQPEGIYLVEPFEVGEGVSLRVVHDGGSRNLITNPSFEVSLDGWSGPKAGESIALTDAQADFGQQSMRMQLTGTETDFQRRSFTWTKGQPMPDGWTVRAQIYAPVLDNAVAEIRVFVQDADGKNIKRYSAALNVSNAGFVPLVINGEALPSDATQITVQLALVPTVTGGTATVYWDGVELIASPTAPLEYCDGRSGGCQWEGDADASPSSRVGGLAGARLTVGDEVIELQQTLTTGDVLAFSEQGITFTDAESGESSLVGPALHGGDDALLSFDGGSLPRIALSTTLPSAEAGQIGAAQ